MDDVQPQPPQPVAPETPPVTPLPDPVTPDADESSHEGFKSVLSAVGLILLAPILALFLTAFVFQSYEVDGPSMQTTLQNKDRLIVLKVPRTWARITHHNYVPHRADIIIFNHPDVAGLGLGDKQLIKRVIGLPGDRVVVKDGKLTIYNKEHPNGFSPDATLPYGKVIKETSGEVDLVVPPGEVFVCGDNRANSLDSRYFGTVPVEDIVGKLGLRIYPFNQSHVF